MTEFSKMTKVIKRWTVTCEFEYLGSTTANSSSEIKPLLLPDGTYDRLALDEYEDFVINLLEVFDSCDFTIIEERESPYSQSRYFSLVRKEDESTKEYKYILFVRISDHSLESTRNSVQQKYFNEHAQELKQPKSKSRQKWKLKKLTVNKDTYFSYEDALYDIEEKLQALK